MDDMCLGVDNGVTKHWVLGNRHGVIRYGKTDSWDEIERIIKHYNCYTLIDANPYPNVPKELADKYPGQVFINYYIPDRKSLGAIRKMTKGDRGVIHSDRTKSLDFLAGEITGGRIKFVMTEREMEGMITHWSNLYRTIEETAQQIKKGVWLVKENKPDHWCFDGSTLISTNKGNIPIKEVNVGDFVLTRKGYKRVLDSGITKENGDVNS